MTFDDAFACTVGHEGSFSDDPADSGGATRFGITEAVARECGYTGSMIDLPFEQAQAIAKARYWDTLNLDRVAALSGPIAAELFDTGYNMGTGRAAQFLQRLLNALNRQQKDYPDLTVDGDIGPATLSALTAFLELRGSEGGDVLLTALNCMQGRAYITLVERREKDERFLYGWLRTRVAI